MAGAPSDLYELCKQFLGVCNDALETTRGGRIDRAFVSPGVPAFDCCPQLSVHAGAAQQADTAPLSPPLQPLHRVEMGMVVPLVTLTATVLRCAPVLEGAGQQPVLPSAAELNEASAQSLDDVWAIWNYVASRKRDGSLWPPRERELIFDPAIPVFIEGGACGWQVQVRVFLGGYGA